MSGIRSLPPKHKAIIDGHALEYICSGAGSPPIVLINGAGGPIAGWYKVYTSLERLSTVFAYNRLGIGGSDRPMEPQTGDVMVETLRVLLLLANLPPPYLLVGHSIGGLYANLFARTYPDEVAGVVLLDATAPDDVRLLTQHRSTFQRIVEVVINAVLGKDKFGEVAQAPETAAIVERADPFPDVPLIVVTGGKPSRLLSAIARSIRATNQCALAALSPQGKQVIAERSGHFPQFSEPNVVVGAIREVLARCVADV